MTFFFYDLETSGVSPRGSRIMQFAGQRTDENLKPIGESYNILIKLSEDCLPDPDAILLTCITPQKTLQDGMTEAEFCKIFMNEIVQPNTCFLGFNTVRFDDEFMRFLLYRNFYDPYSWHWKDGCSRWDILDLVRMTRALRPGDIKWPFDENGVCTNRLELLTRENNLLHDAAHDALSDVTATIAVTNMIKQAQPKLYDYAFSIREKKAVIKFLAKERAFVYSSGRYPSEYDKTTVAYNVGPHPSKQGAFVYNLRHDPAPFLKMSANELADIWKYNPDKEAVRLPVKSMQLNRCPAIAPLGVLDAETAKRLKIDLKLIAKNRKLLEDDDDFYNRLRDAVDLMNKERGDQSVVFGDLKAVDEQLYDNFIPDTDRKVADKLVGVDPAMISEVSTSFKDERLRGLTPLYKARNYPKLLSDDEREIWEEHRKHVLLSGGQDSRAAKFGKRLNELNQTVTDKNKQYLLEELKLYAESIMPDL